MKTRIIIDSTANVSPELKDMFSIVPLTVRFGDQEYIDGVTITNDEFYEKMAASSVLPTTSQAQPHAFTEAFKQATKDGSQAVCITISSRLSGTFQSAMLASQDFEGQVFVVDSRSVSIGAGILAEYALSMAEKGMSAEEIFGILLKERDNIRVFASLDTLKNLMHGGRISKTAYVAGGLLSIKPIACIKGGEISLVAKARGAKQGAQYLRKEIENAGVDFTRPVLWGYTGTDDRDTVNFTESVSDLWEGKTFVPNIASIGSVVGTHAGPGAVAAAFFMKQA